MTDAYQDALQEQAKKSLWDTLAQEAKGMSKLEVASLTADVAGIFDPTPACDVAGGLLSLAQGDLLGVGLSVASFIPYAGDALAKPLKIAKRAPRTAKLIDGAQPASGSGVFKSVTYPANCTTRRSAARRIPAATP